MKRELALAHLLLAELRAAAATADEPGARRIQAAAAGLAVSHARDARAYTVRVTVDGGERSETIPEGRFRFYERGAASGADAGHNRREARELLESILGTRLGAGPLAPSRRPGAWALAVALAIAAASAAFTYRQGTATFNLLDGTYTLESAWRIRSGEVPYRDFVLVLTPGTYSVQALLMLLFGARAVLGLYWAMVVMAATVLLTYHLLGRIGVPSLARPLLSLVPAFGAHAVLPYVWYDADAILACLASLALVLEAERRRFPAALTALCGACASLPFAFKQNIGAAHLVAACGIVIAARLLAAPGLTTARTLAFLAGAAGGLAILVAPFAVLGALPQMVDQTVLFAGKARGHLGGDLLRRFYLPAVRSDLWLADIFVYGLFWLSPVLGATFWFSGTHGSVARMLLPFWIWAVAGAGLFAEGASSTPPLAPLFAILVGLTGVFLASFVRLARVARALPLIAAVVVVPGLIAYAVSGRRLLFYYAPFSDPAPFRSERLSGLSATRAVATDLDEAVSWASRLAPGETFALYPTEDPLYFASGRRSPLSIVQTLPSTGGDGASYLAELERARPAWILVKKKHQFRDWPEPSPEMRTWVSREYRAAAGFAAYDLFRRADGR